MNSLYIGGLNWKGNKWLVMALRKSGIAEITRLWVKKSSTFCEWKNPRRFFHNPKCRGILSIKSRVGLVRVCPVPTATLVLGVSWAGWRHSWPVRGSRTKKVQIKKRKITAKNRIWATLLSLRPRARPRILILQGFSFWSSWYRDKFSLREFPIFVYSPLIYFSVVLCWLRNFCTFPFFQLPSSPSFWLWPSSCLNRDVQAWRASRTFWPLVPFLIHQSWHFRFRILAWFQHRATKPSGVLILRSKIILKSPFQTLSVFFFCTFKSEVLLDRSRQTE